MFYLTLPNEIAHEILIAIVRVRGVKRASRLRYISRWWNVAIMYAIFASGIIQDEKWISPCWEQYLVCYKAIRRPGNSSLPLRIFRRVAERITAHRCPEGSGYTDDALRDSVFELRGLACDTAQDSRYRLKNWLVEASTPIEPIDEDGLQFKQALLAAAAWTNETTLIHQLLPSFQGSEHLVCHDAWGRTDFKSVFGQPMRSAAFQGHDEVVRLFIDFIATGKRENKLFRDLILRTAASQNHFSTIQLGLKEDYNHHDPALVFALRYTRSVDIFKLLLPLARDHLQWEGQSQPDYYTDKFLPEQLAQAAANGNVGMMEHLFHLGVKLPADWPKQRNPILRAARCGQKHALTFLLAKGFVLGGDSLEAAVQHGDPGVVRITLENVDPQYPLWDSLSIAVEKENEVVTRMLLDIQPTRVDDDTRTHALHRAEDLELESMIEMLS